MTDAASCSLMLPDAASCTLMQPDAAWCGPCNNHTTIIPHETDYMKHITYHMLMNKTG